MPFYILKKMPCYLVQAGNKFRKASEYLDAEYAMDIPNMESAKLKLTQVKAAWKNYDRA